MSRSTSQRYDDIAVIFHWAIALLIIGLLIVGKYMTSLEENDPVRFVLTQWHKSFGITVLILSVLRLLWRFTHKPPPALASIALWQQHAASLVHGLLYVLMFTLPITGWIMVSASPLNLDTVLFNVIPWPHLPGVDTLENRGDISHAFNDYHEIAGTILILILLAHIGAAFKHHFLDKDKTLIRMLPARESSAFKRKIIVLIVAVSSSITGLYLYANSGNQAALLAAGDREVSFVADITGEPTPGVFTQTSVEALIYEADPSASKIVARVQTASLSVDDPQVAGSLPEREWFDVQNFPEAVFESVSVTAADDGNLLVTGNLTIKETTQEVSFSMTFSDDDGRRVVRGEFTIDRREFSIGLDSQQSEDFVGYPVMVKFRFDIAAPSS